MLNCIPTLSGQQVSLFYPLEGETFYFDPSHPSYEKVKEELHLGPVEYSIAKTLSNIEGAKAVKLATYTEGKVLLEDGVVYFDGRELNNDAAVTIQRFQRKGLPVVGLMKFIDRLYNLNPSSWAVDSLFSFLVRNNMPILDNGCFVGYKGVREDYTDWYTGRVDNSVGGYVEPFNRNEVDDDRQKLCSFGYHTGSLDYAISVSNYRDGETGHVMLCVIKPEDVVSIPSDSGANKMRSCWYEVVGEHYGSQELEQAYGEDLSDPHRELPQESVVEDDGFWDVGAIVESFGAIESPPVGEGLQPGVIDLYAARTKRVVKDGEG